MESVEYQKSLVFIQGSPLITKVGEGPAGYAVDWLLSLLRAVVWKVVVVPVRTAVDRAFGS